MVKGIEAEIFKSTEAPKGYITISQFARLINQSHSGVYQGLRKGRLKKDQYVYWQSKGTHRKILLIKKSAASDFVNNARPRIVTSDNKS